jgi:hypothetical protein
MPEPPYQPNQPAAFTYSRHVGNYADATELPNLAGAAVQTPRLSVGSVAWAVASSELYVCTDNTPGAATWVVVQTGAEAAGPDGTLVWQWNKTDISQFVGASPDFADAGGAASTLAVTAESERGNVLEIQGAGTNMSALWLVNTPIPFPTNRRDLLIELEMFNMAIGTGGYAGAAYLCDNVGDFHALCHSPYGLAEFSGRIDAGVRSHTSSTSEGVRSSCIARIHVRGEVFAGKPPEVSGYAVAMPSIAADQGGIRRTGTNLGIASVNSFGSGGALPASWNGLGCAQFGLWIQSSGGNPAPTDVKFLDFRVYML